MESIIARQKIGKRRRVEAPRGPRSSILDGKPGRPRSGSAELPLPFAFKQGSSAAPARAASASRSGPAWSHLGRKLKLPRFPRIGLALQRVARKVRLLPKPRLALLGSAVLAAALAAIGGIAWIAHGPAFPLPASGLLAPDDSIQAVLLDYAAPELADAPGEADSAGAGLPPAPVTLEMSTYTVRSGDSLAAIAKRFGLRIDTIISANGISSAASVRKGTELRIPNIDGLVYKVKAGDSLGSISKRFKTDTTRIVDANDLGSSTIAVGQSLLIPGARLPDSAIKQALGQKVAWPVRGPLSSFFGYRPDPFTGVRRFHAGLDIVVDPGTPVRAAMDGKVSDSGYNANYGNYVILSHADGYQTLYGHLTSSSVAIGTVVAQGAIIGLSGNTGYSTGPHLHFGLFRRSLPLNPLKYLK
jgi:murein DD-endopeptidase MepM/ murein hydrolase activator NlpD